MPNLDPGKISILKATIFDMDVAALKQVLFGMVEILKQHPSILKDVFVELVEDGRKYNAANVGGSK